ncbi:hypothetical protein ANCCAN_06177 [Ancylostoma caninum]|uniref:RRM domain-containing protein n=1 Tax=Ancylostoma caninum TaxID=29170 RepID=A0A368GTM0_ANCCA|nr:hypothetical protein ANCCAN_06177 [Ancylostoma caninum]
MKIRRCAREVDVTNTVKIKIAHSFTFSGFANCRDRRDSRRSRSRSPRRRDTYLRSRRDSDDRGGGWRGRRSRREDPDPCRCLGCFNLSVYTTEKDLRELFGEFGEIEKVELVYDHPTGRSRGFGFVYFERLEDACAARDKLTGQEIDGHKIRVDFSLTKRAHTPTPGQYMGAVRGSRRNYGYGSGGYRCNRVFRSERRESYRDGYAGRGSRRRTPSPPRRERHRSRSYD